MTGRALQVVSVVVLMGLSTQVGRPPQAAAKQARFASLREQCETIEFRALDEGFRQRLRADLLQAIRRLQTVRGPSDSDQLQWLGIPADPSAPLQPLLDDRELLGGIQAMLEQDFEPFERAEYQDVLTALQRYVRLLRGREQSDLADEFHRRRALVGTLLDQWRDEGDGEAHRRLAAQVVWLEEHLQGESLVERLRSETSFPNLVLRLPADSLALVSRQTISRREPVTERSRQLTSRGTSHLFGTVQLVPHPGEPHLGAPHSAGAPIRLRFPGTVRLATVNRLGQFSFPSWATTRVDAGLNLQVTPEGLEIVEPVQVAAGTRLRCGRVAADRPGPLLLAAGRVMDRIVAGRREEVAAELNQTIAQRVRDEFERLARQQLPRINQEFTRLLTDPATRLQMRPRGWQVAADDSHLTLRVTEDRHCGLAADAPFEPIADVDSPSLAMHGSFATDLLNSLFRGQNWPRDIDANGLQSFNDQLPVPLFESRQFIAEPRVRLRLHARRPFSADFQNDCVCLRLHADHVEVDEQRQERVDLELHFVVTASRETVRLQLASEPELKFLAEQPICEETREHFTEACRCELLAALKSDVECPSVLQYGGWSIRPDRLISRDGWFTLIAAFQESPLREVATSDEHPDMPGVPTGAGPHATHQHASNQLTQGTPP